MTLSCELVRALPLAEASRSGVLPHLLNKT